MSHDRPTRRTAPLPALLLLALALTWPAPARAAEDVSLTDCTETGLRDAVARAVGGGSVFFACGGPATIRLTQPITVEQPLRLVGDRLVTLSGGGTTRILTVRPGATLTLDGLTLANGTSDALGGAVLNEGNLIAEDVAFVGSRAASGGALYTTSTADLTRATFRGNQATGDGGAVGGAGTITMVDTTIVGNTAGERGGGIASAGDLTITGGALLGNGAGSGGGLSSSGRASIARLTVAGNRAGAAGGGILNDGTLTLTNSTVSGNIAAAGGGAENRRTLTLTNSTVSGNTATGGEGGGIATRGTLTLRNVTVADNSAIEGGGVALLSGEATLRGTLLAGNRANAAPDCRGSFASERSNLVQRTAGCAIPADGNRLSVDPRIEPLADNGGPTRTHALTPSSPAVDGVPRADCLLEDQRGIGRPVPVSGECDIGAYELGFVVNSFADAPDANPRDGACAIQGSPSVCTLRAAIQAANSAPGPDAISFAAPGTITLTLQGSDEDLAATGDLDINGDLLLIGLGQDRTIVDAQGTLLDRTVSVATGTRVTIAGVTLRGGMTPERGGGIRNDGTLTLRDSTITANRAGFGGGVANFGVLTAEGLTLSDNIASFGGGGILSRREVGVNPGGGRLAMADSTVSGNAASGLTASGGGLDLDGDAELSNVTVSDNRADQNGGGLSVGASALVRLNNVTIAGNTADADADGQGDGGGMFAPGAPAAAADPLILQNTMVAGNADRSATLIRQDCTGRATSYGYNLIGVSNECLRAARPTDQVGSSFNPIAAQVGSLASNGGRTQTRALLAGSPAINAGSPAVPGSLSDSCAAADQRALSRPIGAACDIGATEAPLASFQVDITTLSRSTWLVADPVEVLVVVRSLGPSDAEGVRVEITPPAGAALGGVTPSLGNCQGSAPIVCNLGRMASGSAATVTVRFTIRVAGPIELLAAARSDVIDPAPLTGRSRVQQSASHAQFLPVTQR